MEFSGKTCVVSGAAGGMGYALCEQYAKDGANLVLMDVNQEKLDATAQKLEALGAKTLTLAFDITSTKEINEAMEKVESTFGVVNVLANCAGVSIYADMLEYKEEDWDLLFNVNMKGTFFLSQAVAKNMVKHKVKNGKICSISSQAGRVGEPGSHAYGPTKAGIIMLTQTMALDLAPYGICCSAVAPGMTDTPLFRNYLKGACVMEGRTEEEALEVRANTIPLKRLAVPEDVANLIYFLTSEKANYISGATVNITGANVNG